MRYSYGSPLIETKESVPPPPLAPLSPASSADTLHDLISRRKDAEKNKLKYHLTEKDCQLICTNAVDHMFVDGDVIAEAGQGIKNVYRLKAGRVTIVKAGVRLYDLQAVC